MDDSAFRKGQRYGTTLIDLERRRPVDLLPDRCAQSLTAWLRRNPGVEIISRDRGGAYIEGATAGAPQALQVADRWHLIKNLGEALERLVVQQYRLVREVAHQMIAPTSQVPASRAETGELEGAEGVARPVTHLTRLEQHSALKRQQRLAHYTRVWELRRQGLTIGDIAAQTGVSPRTIQRFLRAEHFPERSRRSPQPTQNDPFLPYLRQCLEQGCHNAAQLFREVRTQGYPGGYTSIYPGAPADADVASPNGSPVPISRRGKARSPMRAQVPVPSSRTVVRWFQGHGFSSDPQEQARQRSFLELLYQRVPSLQEAADLGQQFLKILQCRQARELDGWLHRASHSTSKELKFFAAGLYQDLEAVRSALRLDWSNGPVEGQVNRLKMIKRTMYGRAGFELLRARVLPQAA